MADPRVVAVLGMGVVAPDTPVLRADDLGVLRGDGVFETIHVRDREPWLLTEHLHRMAASAARLSIVLPPPESLAELAATAVAAWPRPGEAALRLVCTRGPEGGGAPTVLATVGPVPASSREARTGGVAVLTATLGVSYGVRAESPWLLGGAKTLSYAVNMASLRWAVSQGADDVLWVSLDGYALEAPTATLVWLTDGVLCTVPPALTGVLPGITAGWLLGHAGELGLRAEERMVRPAELHAVDGVWLASSVRGLTEVRSLDGAALAPAGTTGQLLRLLGYSSGRSG